VSVILAVSKGALPQPNHYPEITNDIWRILRTSWKADPAHRPTMRCLVDHFDDIAAPRSTQAPRLRHSTCCRQFIALLANFRSIFHFFNQPVDSGPFDEDSPNCKLTTYRSFLHRLPCSEGASSYPPSWAEHARNGIQRRQQSILLSWKTCRTRIGDTPTNKRFIFWLIGHSRVETRGQAELRSTAMSVTYDRAVWLLTSILFIFCVVRCRTTLLF
jgi:hypothetical protein